MPRKKSTQGKSSQKEKAVTTTLIEMGLTYPQMYYIIWKYAPQLLESKSIETFAELHEYYQCFTKGMTEDFCEKWLMQSIVQEGVKFIQSRQHQIKLYQVYETLYNKAAEGDVQAFKAFVEFGNAYFKDSKENELLSMIAKADLSEDQPV